MGTLHVSEADMLRDPAALLASVRAGFEVVIDGEEAPIAVLGPPVGSAEEPEPGYDEWLVGALQKGLDCDPATDLDDVEAEKYFAARRTAVLARLQEVTR